MKDGEEMTSGPDCTGSERPDTNNPPVDVIHLLSEALHEIAETEWAIYGLGSQAEPSVYAQLHERLLHIKDLIPAPQPYALSRSIVETSPAVSSLRLRTGEAPAVVAHELIQTRNACARKLGREDYAALLLGCSGVDFRELEQWLATTAHALADPAVRGAKWTHYHQQVGQLVREESPLVDFSERTNDQWASLLKIHASELQAAVRPDGEMMGWCQPVDRPQDVRLMIRPRPKGMPLQLLLHELGHYLHYTAPAPEGWQLVSPPPVFDETMASLLEMAGSLMQLGQLIIRTAGPNSRRLEAASVRRWALSALFELRAYQANAESLDAMWVDMMDEYGFAVDSPQEWALDPFYVDDPLYRWHYVLGALWSAAELARTVPSAAREVADKIRELGQAAYTSPWRRVLGLGRALPEPHAYLEWMESDQD